MTTPPTESAGWWLYLLGCSDGRTYAGIARDVVARFDTHCRGKGARFTRANKPIEILGAQAFASRSDALKAEYALKQLQKSAKLAWASRHCYEYPMQYSEAPGAQS